MEKRAVKRSVIVNAKAADVWKALTDPEIIKQWFFGTNVKSDWKKGSPITYSGTWKGKEYEDKGEILEVEENKKLAHTHWSSLSGTEDKPENYFEVIYELEEREKDTVLCITQVGQMSEDTYKHSAENWEMVLNQLKTLVEKQQVGDPVVSLTV
jgi:uncharacterized protein YndB with AHSA1/START domain